MNNQLITLPLATDVSCIFLNTLLPQTVGNPSANLLACVGLFFSKVGVDAVVKQQRKCKKEEGRFSYL